MNKHSKVFDPNCEKILVSKKELQMLGGVSKSMLALNESIIDIKEH